MAKIINHQSCLDEGLAKQPGEAGGAWPGLEPAGVLALGCSPPRLPGLRLGPVTRSRECRGPRVLCCAARAIVVQKFATIIIFN